MHFNQIKFNNIIRNTFEQPCLICALQSVICEAIITPTTVKHTGQTRLLKGISNEVVEVPLVELHLRTEFINEFVLCGVIKIFLLELTFFWVTIFGHSHIHRIVMSYMRLWSLVQKQLLQLNLLLASLLSQTLHSLISTQLLSHWNQAQEILSFKKMMHLLQLIMCLTNRLS